MIRGKYLKRIYYQPSVFKTVITSYSIHYTKLYDDKMKRLQDDKRITRDINMRHMVEIVETSVDEDDISETIYEMHTQWAS